MAPEPSVIPAAAEESKPSPQAREDLTSEKSLEARFGRVRSALGVGTVIQGKLTFDTPVSIDGKLSGEIYSTKELIVGEQGEIDARVEVNCLIVQGRVKGSVKAAERIELWAGGVIEGDISTPAFMMEEGASFNGKCSMGNSRARSELQVSPAQSKDGDSQKDQEKPKSEAASKADKGQKELRVH